MTMTNHKTTTGRARRPPGPSMRRKSAAITGSPRDASTGRASTRWWRTA
jgi:hypothetical protein